MRRVFWIVPLIALLALIGWRVVQKKQTLAGAPKGAAGRGGASVAVEVAKAGPRAMETAAQAVGTAASPQTIKLSPPTSGRITYLEAREGDPVTVGETLIKIDPSQVEGTVLQGIAGVSEAQSKLAQAQATIGSSDVAVESAIRTGRANVASAQAKLDQAKKTQDALVAAAQAGVVQQEAAARSAQADVASAQAQEAAAQANLKTAELKYSRTNELFKGNFIAAQDVDDALAAQESARGQVRVAQQLVAANRDKVAQANAQKAAAQAQVTVAKRQAESGVLTAEADLRSAQAALASAIANRAQGGANRRNVEALQASVRAAQGQLDEANAQRANTELKSPIDGTITMRAADVGTLAQPGTPVLTIQVLKQIYVQASFPVELASQVKPGMMATVSFDSLPEQKFEGRIFDVNRAADPTSRQFSLRVLLDNPGLMIRPGMFGSVRVITSQSNPAVVIPLIALTQTPDGKATVAVLDKDNKVQMRDVTVGQRDEEGVEILKGVEAGETVVTERARAIKDGQTVTVADPNTKPGAGGRAGRKGGRKAKQ